MTDLIDRQAAIDALSRGEGCGNVCRRALERLPSAQPERKKGQWLQKEVEDVEGFDEVQVAKCSVCDRYHTTPYMYYFSDFNFCPNCGAKMEG